MNIVKYEEYAEDLTRFINKHSIKSKLTEIWTSQFENNMYRKAYMFEDGAEFWEVNRVIYERAASEIKGIRFTVDVKLIEHEYWSTDDSKSRYWYEKA